MKRRTYLAAATALSLSGCLGYGDDVAENIGLSNETAGDDGGPADPTNDTDEDDGDEEEEADPELVGEIDDLETFDDFEDLERWEAVIGSLSAEDEQVHVGSQSALLEADGDDDQVRIVRELDAPEDFSDIAPGLAVAAEETVSPVIQLLDEDGDRIDYRQQIHGGLPLTHYTFGISAIHGDPDLSEIVQLQIVFWTGEETEGQLLVDDLHVVPKPDTGTVSLQFDGGYESTYTEAFPVLEEYDYPATVFVPTGRVREEEDHEGDRLTEGQLEDLHDADWTIGSYAAHGLDLTTLDGREPDEELRDAREWLEENGYEDGAGYVSFPSGRYDESTMELVEEYYDLGFVGRYPIHGSVTNPYVCTRLDGSNPDQNREVLDVTADRGGITSLVFYDLEEDSLSDFEETLEHLAELESAGELEVISPREIEEEFLL